MRKHAHVTRAGQPEGTTEFKYQRPEMSDWSCRLFGVDGLTFRPQKGKEPNRWWRFWQRVMFGNKWERAR